MFDNAIFLQFQHPSSFSVSPILLFPFLSFILLLLLTDIHMTICIQVKWECVYHFKTPSTPSHKYISTLLSSDKTSAALASFSLPLCLSIAVSLSLLGEAVFPQCFPFTSNTLQIGVRFPPYKPLQEHKAVHEKKWRTELCDGVIWRHNN